MGLAEPRKRLKIAHDPRNLSWTSSAPTSSIGHRLMKSQGWSEGQSLGARTPSTRSGTSTPNSATADDTARLAAAKIGVLFKDDNLGLGAKLKSKDVEGQKTGLDAFQGLLGRLNSKNIEEEKENERMTENRKLEGYVRSRWGGMMFVPGGVLVQGEAFRSKKEAREVMEKHAQQEAVEDGNLSSKHESRDVLTDESTERKRRKEERRARKEQRRKKKAAKLEKKEQQLSTNTQQSDSLRTPKSSSMSAPDEATSSDEEAEKAKAPAHLLEQHPSTIMLKPAKEIPRNGRQILRGRNIEAKRKAFTDMKGLDAIFMK